MQTHVRCEYLRKAHIFRFCRDRHFCTRRAWLVRFVSVLILAGSAVNVARHFAIKHERHYAAVAPSSVAQAPTRVSGGVPRSNVVNSRCHQRADARVHRRAGRPSLVKQLTPQTMYFDLVTDVQGVQSSAATVCSDVPQTELADRCVGAFRPNSSSGCLRRLIFARPRRRIVDELRRRLGRPAQFERHGADADAAADTLERARRKTSVVFLVGAGQRQAGKAGDFATLIRLHRRWIIMCSNQDTSPPTRCARRPEMPIYRPLSGVGALDRGNPLPMDSLQRSSRARR